MSCIDAGGMENLLQLIERQRERKANQSVSSSHNSSGSDMHDSGATFTVGALNITQDVDKTCHTSGAEPLQTTVSSVDRLQSHVDDVVDCTVNLDHIRHRVDEQVVLRSETNSLWRKDETPKIIPRKVASMPVSSCHSTSKSVFALL